MYFSSSQRLLSLDGEYFSFATFHFPVGSFLSKFVLDQNQDLFEILIKWEKYNLIYNSKTFENQN